MYFLPTSQASEDVGRGAPLFHAVIQDLLADGERGRITHGRLSWARPGGEASCPARIPLAGTQSLAAANCRERQPAVSLRTGTWVRGVTKVWIFGGHKFWLEMRY